MVGVNTKFRLDNSKIDGITDGQEVTLKQLMSHVVKSGQISITPKHFDKTYFHWIDNLRDWCISRQIWYGHRIPVWYKGDELHVGISAPDGEEWEQDSDTLDTWFSSGLWTFSTLGWPDKTDDLKNFHPTSVLETGYDILFFWVARMILMSTCLLGEVPFRKILLHGLVRDAQKQKMSKSKGNVIDPLTVSDVYGTDALRLALVFSTSAGSDIPMSEDKIRGMKFFANKLWNIARFIELNTKDKEVKYFGSEIGSYSLEKSDSKVKNWSIGMHNELRELEKEVTKNIESFQLNLAATKLYEYTWHKFADEHIETSKAFMSSDGEDAMYARGTLLDAFQRILKLLHPFMPYITEEIYKKLYGEEKSIMIQPWPKA